MAKRAKPKGKDGPTRYIAQPKPNDKAVGISVIVLVQAHEGDHTVEEIGRRVNAVCAVLDRAELKDLEIRGTVLSRIGVVKTELARPDIFGELAYLTLSTSATSVAHTLEKEYGWPDGFRKMEAAIALAALEVEGEVH